MTNQLVQKLGVFAKTEFLPLELSKKIIAEMNLARDIPALVNKPENNRIDEGIRKTKVKNVTSEITDVVTKHLLSLKPELERYFDISLNNCQKPQFLKYKSGDFFIAHQDNTEDPNSPEFIRQRKVSVVIFLNDRSQEPQIDKYCGGALVFYGLIKDNPAWQKNGFPVWGESGLLVAFRSDTMHEVKPVTDGDRYTIVTWFV